ncbi:hypothetical protein GCM10011611_04440 [Aliidongia dinghuensis]|uniref:Uncharacterized protein n=1 Tax=Aliidongia dinghuensis TaxID=1867774 RepID=A0A8J2YPU6_9PROT|nr:hypothetical protein [Aliidongia dinghuensis]GGF02049.1 hypothetical protein GCM10011611_04440 [Aliidongia dinghuensis]
MTGSDETQTAALDPRVSSGIRGGEGVAPIHELATGGQGIRIGKPMVLVGIKGVGIKGAGIKGVGIKGVGIKGVGIKGAGIYGNA